MTPWPLRTLRPLIASLLLAPCALLAAPAEAADHEAAAPTSPLARRLALAEAIRLGATQGPAIGPAAAPRTAFREAQRAAGALFPILPHATITAGGRRNPAGLAPEVSVTLLQDLSLGGLGGARRDLGAALARLTEADLARARLDGATRAALAWVSVAEADAVLALRQEGLEQARSILRAVAARSAAGAEGPLELRLAEGEVATARAAVLDAEGMRFEAGLELAFAAGLPLGAPLGAAGSLEDTVIAGPDGGETELTQRAEREHPTIQLTEAQGEVTTREAELTAAERAPIIAVGAAYTREGTGDQIGSLVFSLPLPLGRPAAFDAARGRAAAAVARAQTTAARGEVTRDIHAAVHEREHTRELHEALEQGALGPAREGLRLARAQLDAGTLDATRAILARQRLLAVEEQIARTLADVRRADIRLLRAAGLLIDGSAR